MENTRYITLKCGEFICGLFTTLSAAEAMVGTLVKNELERKLEGSGHDLLQMLSWQLP
jgi:hypothetical protein